MTTHLLASANNDEPRQYPTRLVTVCGLTYNRARGFSPRAVIAVSAVHAIARYREYADCDDCLSSKDGPSYNQPAKKTRTATPDRDHHNNTGKAT